MMERKTSYAAAYNRVNTVNNHSNFNAICDIKILCAFLLVSLVYTSKGHSGPVPRGGIPGPCPSPNHYLCPGVPILVVHWGGRFAILFHFCPIFNIGGMNLDHDFFQISKLKWRPKKKVSFFPEFKWRPKNWSKHHPVLRCRPESNYWGDISPIPLGCQHPCLCPPNKNCAPQVRIVPQRK